MADLGVLSITHFVEQTLLDREYIAPYLGTDKVDIQLTGSLDFVVKVNGVVEPNSIVLLYHEPTSVLVKKAWSNESGLVTFTGLQPDVPIYYAVAIPNGAFEPITFHDLIATE